MSLRNELLAILPSLLPVREQDAIKGTELIARVRAVLGNAYSDHSLRSQFSFIALEPDSCLARVPNGQGYYLRGEASPAASLHDMFEEHGGDDAALDSLHRKALALAVRLYDTAGLGVFVYPVDEEEESWSHPDLVAVQWPQGTLDATGAYIPEPAEDGRPTASFRAVCVAEAGEDELCRRAFFRTLACGQWAQESELLLLGLAEEVPEELLRLAARYGVGIRTLEAHEEVLETMPPAKRIFLAEATEARQLLSSLSQGILAHPRRQSAPAAPPQHMPDIAAAIGWAQGCLDRGRIEPYEQRVAVN